MAKPPNPKGVRARIARGMLRVPFVGRMYMKAMLKTLDRTPRSKLPPELQSVQAMLQQVPKNQRLDMLEAAMKGKLPQPEQYGRSVRRAAKKQQATVQRQSTKPKRKR